MPGLTVTTRHSHEVVVTNGGIPARKACSPGTTTVPEDVPLAPPGGGERAGAEDREELREREEKERFVVRASSSRWRSHPRSPWFWHYKGVSWAVLVAPNLSQGGTGHRKGVALSPLVQGGRGPDKGP